MTEERNGIAVLGSLLVDKIYTISAYPEAGALTKIRDISLAVGGCVPNVAIDMKKLSPELPVFAVGCIGRDAEGEFLKKTLKESSVDTSNISESSVPTSFTAVMSVEGGQRTFFTYPGASSEFGLREANIDNLNARMLHLGYFLLLDKVDAGDGVKILKAAKDRGITTSIDLVSENSDRYSLVLPALPYTDNLIINEVEAGALTGISPERKNLFKIAERLIELGVRERVIIHSPEISILKTREDSYALPSYELPNGFISGTTGAGDAFCAGALIGIYENRCESEILELASCAAVSALSKPDATSGLREEAEAVALCKNFERKNICL